MIFWVWSRFRVFVCWEGGLFEFVGSRRDEFLGRLGKKIVVREVVIVIIVGGGWVGLGGWDGIRISFRRRVYRGISKWVRIFFGGGVILRVGASGVGRIDGDRVFRLIVFRILFFRFFCYFV